MGRSPCFDKLRMKQEVLANDNDCTKRFAYMAMHGSENWTPASKKEELVGRYGKSCKLMRKTSDCLKQSFTPQEEDLIIKLHATIGSRWFIIAQQLPGRTDNEVKTIWNTKLRKKLTAMGIDPVTHRPFSQILADYGNIGACSNANKSRFGSLTRNMKANSDLCTSVITSDSGCSSNYETSRNSMISNNNNNNNDHNLLSQLEAIKLVTETDSSYSNNTEYMTSLFNYEFSSQPPDASSSESHSSSSNQGAPSPGFNWIDFLLEDELPSGTIMEPVNQGNSSRDMFLEDEPNDVCNAQMNNFEATLPSSRSFVESILENEHDMLSDFHGLAEDQFYY